jgi:hypothetical protein
MGAASGGPAVGRGGRGVRGGVGEESGDGTAGMSEWEKARHREFVRSVLHANAKELAALRQAHDEAVRRRLAMQRVYEDAFVRAAHMRSAAAARERRLTALRARRFVEDMHRRALSRALRRSSAVDAVASALLRATADEQRKAASEAARFAAEQALAARETVRVRREAALHEARVRAELRAEADRSQARELRDTASNVLRTLREETAEVLSAVRADASVAEAQIEARERQWVARVLDGVDPRQTATRFPVPDLDARRAVERAAATAAAPDALPGSPAPHGKKGRARARPASAAAASARFSPLAGSSSSRWAGRGASMTNRTIGGGGGGAAGGGKKRPPTRNF